MRRIDRIKKSGIRELFEKATEKKDLINLGIGEPDLKVPDLIKKEIIKSLNNNETKYVPTSGVEKLKNKILNKYSYNSVIITPGVSSAIFYAYSVLFEKKDELIIFDPYFVVYPNLCRFLNIKPTIVKTNDDFSINFENLKNSISKKTKGIMINSPNNPSGHVISKTEMEKIIDVARKNDLWIISDEIYEAFDYENKFVSVDGKYDKAIILNGFSKIYSMTGLRLGYAIGPKNVIDDMTKLQQYTCVSASSICQFALANVDESKIDIKERIEIYKERREYVYEKLKDHYEIIKPEGAFYMYIKTPKNLTGTNFSQICLENNLLVVPSKTFSLEDKYFRISFGTDDITLKKACDKLIEIRNKLYHSILILNNFLL
jgi:aspartate aminotransferase